MTKEPFNNRLILVPASPCTAAQAAHSIFLNRDVLQQRREELLQPYGEGAWSKVGGFGKELLLPMAGIAGQSLAYVFQKGFKWTGNETESGKLSERQWDDWRKRTGGFVHKMLGRDEVTTPLAELKYWASDAGSVDDLPDEFAQRIARAAFTGYHQLTEKAAQDLNTTQNTFNVKKDPSLRAALENYLHSANPGAFASLDRLMFLDQKTPLAPCFLHSAKPRLTTCIPGLNCGRGQGSLQERRQWLLPAEFPTSSAPSFSPPIFSRWLFLRRLFSPRPFWRPPSSLRSSLPLSSPT